MPGPSVRRRRLPPFTSIMKMSVLPPLDPRQGRLVELRYFGGLSIEETAEALGISAARQSGNGRRPQRGCAPNWTDSATTRVLST